MVLFTILYEITSTDPNLIPVTPVKPVPVIVTLVPTGPVLGRNEVMLCVPTTQALAVVTDIWLELEDTQLLLSARTT